MARRLNRRTSQKIGAIVCVIVVVIVALAVIVNIVIPFFTESSKESSSIMLNTLEPFEEGETDVTEPATISLIAINYADPDQVEIPEDTALPEGTKLLEFSYKIDNPDEGQRPLFIPESDYFLVDNSGQVLYSGRDYDRDYSVAQRNGREDIYDMYFPVKLDTVFYLVKLNNNGLLKQIQNVWKFTPEQDGYRVDTISLQDADKLGINYQLIKDYMDAHGLW